MSKSGINKRGRSERTPGGYTSMDNYMLNCSAWKALSGVSRGVYRSIKQRHRDYGGGKSNNGYISMSRREAAAITGFSESSMRRAFPDLIEKGFIKINRESGFEDGERRAREYVLTEFPVGGELSTKEYMRWVPTPRTVTRKPKLRVHEGGRSRLLLSEIPFFLTGIKTSESQYEKREIQHEKFRV